MLNSFAHFLFGHLSEPMENLLHRFNGKTINNDLTEYTFLMLSLKSFYRFLNNTNARFKLNAHPSGEPNNNLIV